MSKLLTIVILVAAVGGGAALYLRGFGRGDAASQLPPPLAQWQRHLSATGLDSSVNLVRAGARERLRFNGMFQLKGAPRPLFLQWYETSAAAQNQLRKEQQYPAGAATLARGELLLVLSDWPLDDPLTQQVRSAFQSFDAPEARAAP